MAFVPHQISSFTKYSFLILLELSYTVLGKNLSVTFIFNLTGEPSASTSWVENTKTINK